MIRKSVVALLSFIMIVSAMGCGVNKHTEPETEMQSTIAIDYSVKKPLVLEEVYHDEDVVGECKWTSFERIDVDSSSEDIIYEVMFAKDDMTVKYGKTDDGKDCLVVSNSTKSANILCPTINMRVKAGYVYYGDFTKDGKEEIFIIFWYDDNKYGAYFIDPDTLEKIDAIAPSGTMFTQKQAKDINDAIAKFKQEYPEYLYKWVDIKGATGEEKTLGNDTTEYFNVKTSEEGMLEVDVIHQGYPSSEYTYIVTVQLAYINGECVVYKVILDAHKWG